MTDFALAGPRDRPSGEQPSTPSLRQFLRMGTRERHARLDRFFEGMTETDNPALYHRFIQMNHRCHAVLEPRLADCAGFAAVLGSNRREKLLPALEADMRRMELRALDIIAFPLQPLGLPEAAGIAYVLDGSRLGARLIHRNVVERDLTTRWPEVSTCYLEAAAVADSFRDRMSDLSAALPARNDRDRALLAAKATFTYFQTVLDSVASGSPFGTPRP